jgi:hypothetical protein
MESGKTVGCCISCEDGFTLHEWNQLSAADRSRELRSTTKEYKAADFLGDGECALLGGLGRALRIRQVIEDRIHQGFR